VGNFTHLASGKVREIYEVDDAHLLMVASDRISAYDVVLSQPIPDKGRVLTALSWYWFETLGHICPHHAVATGAVGAEIPDWDDLEGRAMLCWKAAPIPLEFVVRGYLAGSAWREYRERGTVCGHPLPGGLRESDALPRTLLTPATKAVAGHDENITEDDAAKIAGKETYESGKRYAMELYETAAGLASGRGVIIADTKFEFGVRDGMVILIDEVLTPDSSRFWPADSYAPGGPQPSFDKQYVRDWLDATGWDHRPPPPDLPGDVIDATSSRYREAYERLTGLRWAAGQTAPGGLAPDPRARNSLRNRTGSFRDTTGGRPGGEPR
jgi:phosphoribosylaminoimidazole-succinocarboxamide synthase